MKIVILQDYLRSGGTERQSLLLARAFTAAGHPTTLVTFRPGGQLAAAARGLTHRSLQPWDCHLDWFAPGLHRVIAELAPAIVLPMGRMANCYAGGLQRRLARRGVPGAVVGTLRTGKELPLAYRRSLRAVRHVVANSEDARAVLLRREGLPADRVSVIANSLIFPEAAAPPPPGVRAQWGAGPATFILVCVAMFRPEKNQRALIEVAASLRGADGEPADWQLWLAGDGPTRAACEHLVRDRGLADRVKFLGLVADPGAVYAAADLAVHASRRESLSNFLIEAQAHGLPVVAAAAQGISECFVPGETGWMVPAGDLPAFRRVLLERLAEPATVRAARRVAAREFARRQFDPARQTQAYLDLFARLAP